MIHLIGVKCAASEYFFLYILRGSQHFPYHYQHMSRKSVPYLWCLCLQNYRGRFSPSLYVPVIRQRMGSCSHAYCEKAEADGLWTLDNNINKISNIIIFVQFTTFFTLNCTKQYKCRFTNNFFLTFYVLIRIWLPKGCQITDHQIISRYCLTGQQRPPFLRKENLE